MQNPKLGDASFAMSTTCCNDYDWGDSSYDIENLFKPHDEYNIDYIDESGFGEVMTLFSDESSISEEVPIDYENKVAIYDDYCDDLSS